MILFWCNVIRVCQGIDITEYILSLFECMQTVYLAIYFLLSALYLTTLTLVKSLPELLA